MGEAPHSTRLLIGAGRELALDEVDWAAVRRAYEGRGETMAAIRARFGVSRWMIAKRRLAEGWTARPSVATPGPLRGRRGMGAAGMTRKLNAMLALGAAMLQGRLEAEGMSPENAQMLRDLCRAQEAFMQKTTTKKAAKARESKNHEPGERRGGRAGRDDVAGGDDLAELRAALKSRLARLRASSPAR